MRVDDDGSSGSGNSRVCGVRGGYYLCYISIIILVIIDWLDGMRGERDNYIINLHAIIPIYFAATAVPRVTSSGSFFSWMNSFLMRVVSEPLSSLATTSFESISFITRSHTFNTSVSDSKVSNNTCSSERFESFLAVRRISRCCFQLERSSEAF